MQTSSLNMETLDALKEYADPSDPGFLRDLLDTYLEDTRARLEQLRAAHAAADTAGFGRLAHAIKGSSINMGADGLAESMQVFEREAKKGHLPAVDSLEEAVSRFSRAQAELLAFFAGK